MGFLLASPITFLPFSIRKKVYIKHKMAIGENTLIGRGFQIDIPEQVQIGSNSLINYNCSFYVSSGGGREQPMIIVGDNTQIGYGSSIICGSHILGPHERRAGTREAKPVRVGNGCWIGANVTILPGVTICDGCVIAAGAVVANDCEEDSLYAGVPAKKIKELPK